MNVTLPGNIQMILGLYAFLLPLLLYAVWTTLALWDLDSGSLIRQGQGTSGHLGLAVRPDGRLVLTADRDGVVRIWSPASLRLPTASGPR